MKTMRILRAWVGAAAMLALACAQAATPAQQMSAALATWVAEQNGVGADRVQVGPLDPRVPVQPCAGGYRFDYPFVNRDSVRVRCVKPNWQLFVKVAFANPGAVAAPAAAGAPSKPATPAAEIRQVVVAAANLSAGQVLQPQHLKMDPLEADKISRSHYVDVAGLEGQEVLRPIRAGDAIRTTDVRPALLVKKGEMVLMTVGSPETFQISVKAEALQDGRLGEQIKLRNPESGRSLSAIVTGKGTARGG